MNTYSFGSVVGAGVLSFGMFASAGAEPLAPNPPAQKPSTNMVVYTYRLSLPVPHVSFYTKPIAEMFDQRLRERISDSLTPLTLQSITQTKTSYEAFVHGTSQRIIEGAVKQTAKDWMMGHVLADMEFKGKPLLEYGQGFLFGSFRGIQRRELTPRESMYTFTDDLIFHPREEHPSPHSWGVDIFRTNPKVHAIIAGRGGTRMVRMSTSYDVGEMSADILDPHLFVRVGARVDYQAIRNQSYGFISLAPTSKTLWNLPLNLNFLANPKGEWTISFGMNKRF